MHIVDNLRLNFTISSEKNSFVHRLSIDRYFLSKYREISYHINTVHSIRSDARYFAQSKLSPKHRFRGSKVMILHRLPGLNMKKIMFSKNSPFDRQKERESLKIPAHLADAIYAKSEMYQQNYEIQIHGVRSRREKKLFLTLLWVFPEHQSFREKMKN